MKHTLIALCAVLMPGVATAANVELPLFKDYRAELAPENKDSLRNGARLFVNYCLSCHSAQHVRYNVVANDLGIEEKLALDKLILVGDFSKKPQGESKKIGATMNVAMRPEDGKLWFGSAAPDLSLIARSRGADWLYAYLNTFYIDEKRAAMGVNNARFPNVSMPHVLWQLEGLKRALYETKITETIYDASGKDIKVVERVLDPKNNEISMSVKKDLTGGAKDGEGWKRETQEEKTIVGFEMVQSGSLSEAQYKRATNDLVNFLAYIAEPRKLERQRIGVLVVLFLLILFVFAYLLKREYWKDVH